MNENKIKLIVAESSCPLYKEGDSIYFDGPLIDKERSGNLCMTALSAVFPFVYAARKGIVKDSLLQCPDCREGVKFIIKVDEK